MYKLYFKLSVDRRDAQPLCPLCPHERFARTPPFQVSHFRIPIAAIPLALSPSIQFHPFHRHHRHHLDDEYDAT
jgi:hypothetical protein